MPASTMQLSSTPNLVGEIPMETQDSILEGTDYPFSVAEAKALKLEFMKERESFMINHCKVFEDTIQFSV